MRRGKPLARRTELRNTTPLESRSELTRKSPMPRQRVPLSGSGLSQKARQQPKRTPWKPTRKRVSPQEREGRRLLAQRSGHRCEIGGGVAAEAHHRKNRSQGGTWTVSNLLHLCSEHHLHVTTHPQAAREQGWAVRSTHDPAETPVWLYGRGWSVLDDDGGIHPAEPEDEEKR